MFKPELYWDNTIEIEPGKTVSITLEGWFGWLFRVKGGPHTNAWRIGERDAVEEFYRRVNDTHFANEEYL